MAAGGNKYLSDKSNPFFSAEEVDDDAFLSRRPGGGGGGRDYMFSDHLTTEERKLEQQRQELSSLPRRRRLSGGRWSPRFVALPSLTTLNGSGRRRLRWVFCGKKNGSAFHSWRSAQQYQRLQIVSLWHAYCLALRAPTLDLWLELTRSRKFVIQGCI